MLAPVLAAQNQQRRDRVLAPDHAAIDADVLHAGVRVLGDDAGISVDVAPALQVVPFRHREFEQVDRIALDDVLLDRPGRDPHRRDALAVLFHHVLDDLAVAGALREAQRQRQPLARADAAAEHAPAARILVAADVLEQQRRALALQHLARDRADLAVPAHRRGDAVDRKSTRLNSSHFPYTTLFRSLDDLAVAGALREAQRQRQPLARADAAAEHAPAARILVAADVLEQQRRALALQHLARDRADLAVPAHRRGDA